MQKDFFENLEKLQQKKMTLTLSDDKKVEKVATALNSSTRRKILAMLGKNSFTIMEIAENLNMSVSNISFHVKLLQQAGFINLTHNASKRGNEKIVALEKHCLELFCTDEDAPDNNFFHSFNTELPIGSFSLFDIAAPCGIADAEGHLLGAEALPDIFYSYRRIKAEIVWFTSGYLEYHIPNTSIKNNILQSIVLSAEICSECANYNNSFKSDITFWLNDKEVCTYTSPGDFGGRRGIFTPANWPSSSTQFGMLVQIRIDENGILLNHQNVSGEYCIDDFAFLTREKCIRLKIGVKPNAKYPGGINLFGKNFGDYAQGIRFTANYTTP